METIRAQTWKTVNELSMLSGCATVHSVIKVKKLKTKFKHPSQIILIGVIKLVSVETIRAQTWKLGTSYRSFQTVLQFTQS